MLLPILPPDPTSEEVKIIRSCAVSLYQKIEDPMDKFIVAMVFDMGYGREETADALGVSYVTVWKRINKIMDTLENIYKKENLLVKVKD